MGIIFAADFNLFYLKLMKKYFIAALMAVSVLCLTSCYCDKYAVGTINPEEPLVHVVSEHNQSNMNKMAKKKSTARFWIHKLCLSHLFKLPLHRQNGCLYARLEIRSPIDLTDSIPCCAEIGKS